MRRLRRGLRDLTVALPYVLPGLVLFAVLVVWPLLRGLQISFYDWKLLDPSASEFVGLKNFQRALFADRIFWIAVRNTLLYVIITVPGQMAFGMLAALLLNTRLYGKGLWRVLYYLPVVTSWLVVIYIFEYLFSGGPGPVNYLLQNLHLIKGPLDWLNHTWTAQVPINLLGIWKGIGYTMVLFLAGLQSIPKELYEAATTDGATRPQIFWRLTLPLLTPTVLFVAVMLTIGAFNVFLQVFLMTHGGPMGGTEVWLDYMYTQAFTYFEFGYGAAIAMLFGITVVAITLVQRRYIRGATLN